MTSADIEYFRDFWQTMKTKEMIGSSGFLYSVNRLRDAFVLPSVDGPYKDRKNLCLMKMLLWLQYFEIFCNLRSLYTHLDDSIALLEDFVNIIGRA